MPSISKKKLRFASLVCTRLIRKGKALNKVLQFSLRLKTLIDKKRVVQSRTVTNSKAPANFVALFEGFQQFDGDLNKLQVGSFGWSLLQDLLNQVHFQVPR